jgi:hypothetical protein
MTARKTPKPAPRKASRTKAPAKTPVRKPAPRALRDRAFRAQMRKAERQTRTTLDQLDASARAASNLSANAISRLGDGRVAFDLSRPSITGDEPLTGPCYDALLDPIKPLTGDWKPSAPRLSNDDLCAVQRLLDCGHVKNLDEAVAKVRELRYGYAAPVAVMVGMDLSSDRGAAPVFVNRGYAAFEAHANGAAAPETTESHLRALDAYVSTVANNLDALVLQLGPVLRAHVPGVLDRESNQAGSAEVNAVAPAYSPLTGRVMGIRHRLAILLGVIEDATMQLDLPIPAPTKAQS